MLLLGAAAYAQEWTVIELPEKEADMPQLVQDLFGCSYQELPEKYNITHLRFTGTDFFATDHDTEGQEAIAALIKKAKVIDLSQIDDNEESVKWWADGRGPYPGPRRFYTETTWYLSDSLEHFIFPRKLTSISENLASCKKLKQVTWPDKVIHLAWHMFRGCESLEEMTLPDSIDGTPEGCFYNCSSLKSVTLPVTKGIGKEAFRSCSSLEQIVIPEGVETIEEGCFLYCRSLQQVTLPSTVTEIGASAFEQCRLLKSIRLPEQLKAISSSMFNRCDSLQNVIVFDSVTSIGSNAFVGCKSLLRVDLPANLVSIGGFAFDTSGLKELDMPDGVTELGDGVFSGCEQLERVHLSRQLTAIPQLTFAGCQCLEDVNIPHRITSIGKEAFYNCQKLKKIVLQEGVTHIGTNAFLSSGLEQISLPRSLQFIASESFRYTPLRSIAIPDGVIEIGEAAFANCDSLQNATLSEGLLYLKKSAFSECSLLEDVALPTTLRVLGEWVFSGNKQKRSYTQPTLINSVPNHICSGCDSLASVTLHERVTTVGECAFENCYKLTGISLPQGLQTIGSSAFAECKLAEVNIPSSVRLIDSYAFSGGAYHSVVLPEGVESVGDRAFYSDSLRHVDFPSTIAVLGDYALQGGGPSCERIVLRAALPPRTTGTPYSIWNEDTLYVPAASVEAYRRHEVFANSFTGIEPLTDYTINNIMVSKTVSTDSVWFPVTDNANLTITYNEFDNDRYQGGHLHVGKNTAWAVNHLRYDYHYGTTYSDEKDASATLINDGQLSVASMEMKLDFRPNEWMFFAPPFDMKVSDLKCSDPRTPYVLRTFDGAQRAAGNHSMVWPKVDENDVLQAGHGYILQYGGYPRQTGSDSWKIQNSGISFNLQSPSPFTTSVFSADEVTIPLTDYKGEFPHNEGWNFVANPFIAYFDIRQLETDGPIIVAAKSPYNTLTPISPLDDEYILPPLRAFLIQQSVTQKSITFHSEGRQDDGRVHTPFVNDSRSLRRSQLRRQRIVCDVVLQHQEERAATTRIVLTPRATEGYDRGQDAPFITLDGDATTLYSRTAGLRYSFNELPPTTVSVEIGMHLAEAGSYTLSMSKRGEAAFGTPDHFWLTDRETGAQTDLLSDSYTFSIEEPGTLSSRFVLQLSDGITAVPFIEALPQYTERLYDLQGRRIATPAKGVFIKGGKKIIK
jgi:hypothetical protein